MASLRQSARKASEGTAQADASTEQALPGARSPRDPAPAGIGGMGPTALGQNTRVDWRRAALRLGEELASDGPVGYYNMRPDEWLRWALSVRRR